MLIAKQCRAFAATAAAAVRPSVASHHLNVPPTRVTTLRNGLRVATEDSGLSTCTVGVYIDAGSRFETEQNNGAAHFLEHLSFKGTKRRTREGLEIEVENVGSRLNAYTSREQTVYYAQCMTKDLEQHVDLLSDILLHSSLSKRHIEEERGVILREMQDVQQDMQEVVFDLLHEEAYKGTPLGFTILGPVANIQNLKRDDMSGYLQDNYRGPRMVLACAGGVDHKLLASFGEKYFGQLSAEVPQNYMAPAKYSGGQIYLPNCEMQTVYGALAMEGAAWEDPDVLSLMIVNCLIGQWDRSMGSGQGQPSRLAQTVSVEECQKFQAFCTCYKDTGLFGVYFACSPNYVDEMVRGIWQQWTDIARTVDVATVERGKRLLRTNMQLMLDGTTAIAEDVGRQMLCYGRRIPQHEMEARIDAIDVPALRRVCKKVTERGPAVLAATGRTDSISSLNSLLL